MGCLPFILFSLGVALLSWIAWVSLQSLLQARILYRLDRLAGASPDPLGRQAVHGRVRIDVPLTKGFGQLLWCRTEEQVYRRRGKNSSWKTESTLEETARFVVETGEGALVLSTMPTEVQGTATRTETHDRSGWFGGHGNGDRRTVYTFLLVPATATVVGRREGPATLGKDNKLGLLLSPHEPGKAAGIELWKGIGGLVLVSAAVIVGLMIYYGQGR